MTSYAVSTCLELMLSSWVLVSSGHEGTLPIEGVVETVESGVVRVTVSFAHTVMAPLRTDAFFTLAHQARGTEAASDA